MTEEIISKFPQQLDETTTLADGDITTFEKDPLGATPEAHFITWANLKTLIGSALGGIINALTGKTTPVDADYVVIGDSAASNASKKLTWANIKATLLSYFNTAYVPLTRTITTTAPLYIDGAGSANLSANRTLAIVAAAAGTGGYMSSGDKVKLDSFVAPASYVATITASSGVFTTVSCDYAYYAVLFGNLVWYSVKLTITNAGTATGELRFTVPYTVVVGGIGDGREDAATGVMLQAIATPSNNYIRVVTNAGGSVIASGRVIYASGFFIK